jgi:hypothetical protein
MLQTILKADGPEGATSELEYVFPTNCYRQVVEWLLSDAPQLGLEPFDGVKTTRGAVEVRVLFPSEAEQDKMHRFFEMFNAKRRQAQGIDPSFPPMPDVYQGESKPVDHVVRRYMALIAAAFDGDISVVPIPVGSNGEEFDFHCD